MKSHYALRFTNRPGKPFVRYTMSSNADGDYCAEMSVVLSDSEYDSIWVTNEKHEVEAAIIATDDWWLSVRNPFKEELEMVEVKVVEA